MPSILCFGDSNTWGAIPGTESDRYGPDVRWHGVMAKALGSPFEVAEAGLSGRTTVFERLPRLWRSGRDLLVPTMETHSPLDVVIILLGTNDVSLPYLSVADITRGAGELISIVRFGEDFGPRNSQPPVPLLIAPHVVGPLNAEDVLIAPGSEERSRELVSAYRTLTGRLNCDFLNLSTVVEPSQVDPWHWEAAGHQAAGHAVAAKVRAMYPGVADGQLRALAPHFTDVVCS